MNEVTIKIHESNLDFFNDKLAELNEMFAKKHLPLISCSMTEEEMYSVDEWTKEKHPYILYTAHLTSEFEQTNLKGIDCNFEGVISLVDGNENDKIYTFENINYSSLLADCKCDECNKKIGRNKYIVFSKTENVKTRDDLIVLGTSCAKNYFPFDIERYFGFLESAFTELGGYDEYDGEYSFGKGNSKYKDLCEVYYATCRMTENLKIYKKEGETRGDVEFIMDNESKHIAKNSNMTWGEKYPIPETTLTFHDFSAYIEEAYNKSTEELRSDFDVNARSVFFKTDDNGNRTLRNYIDKKYLGIAVWGFFSAKKNHDRLVEKKIAEENRMKENAKVEYFGNVGDKFELTLTFDKMFAYENNYGYYGGTTFILLFHDDENHVFKWSSSNGDYKIEIGKDIDVVLTKDKQFGNTLYCDYKVGHKYLIKGSIKSHEEYKGCKQTVITRCKVVDDFIERKVEIKENIKGDKIAHVEEEDPFETLCKVMDSVEQSA